MTFKNFSVVTIVAAALVAITTALVGVFGWMNISSTRDRAEARLRTHLATSIDQLSSALTLPIWNFDFPQAATILETQMRDQNISSIVVIAGERRFALNRDAQWNANSTDRIIDTVGLLTEKRAISVQNESIGSVTVYMTPQFLNEDLRRAMWNLAGALVLLDLFLVLALYLVLWRIVLKPLRRIEQFASAVHSEGSHNRTLQGHRFRGELENVRSSIQEMVGLLDSRYAEIQQANQHLQEEIGERIQKEKALQESESRIRSISNNLTDGMIYRVVMKPDGTRTFTYLSDSVRQLYGISPEEGMADSTLLYGKIHKDDIASLMDAEAEAGQRLSIFRAEARIKDPSGEYRWSSMVSTPTKANDGSIWWDGIEFVITERKQAEEKLEREQSLLQTLMDNIPDHIYYKDAGSHFTRINKAQADKFGLSDPAQAIGKSGFDFFMEEHARKAFDDEQSIMRTGQPLVGVEEMVTLPNGHVTWVSTTKMPLRDRTGEIIGTFGVSRDITRQKQTELQLRLSEEKFSGLFHSSPDAILLTELKSGTIIEVNDSFEKFSGFSRDELVGHQVLETSMYSPAERERFVSMLRKQGSIQDVEFSLQDKAGKQLSVLASAELIEIHDKTHVITILHDITERKLSEEALRQGQKSESIGTLAGGIAHDFNNLLNAIMGQSSLALGKLPKESPARNNIDKSIKAAERAADLTRQLLAYSGKGKFVTEEIDLNRLVEENGQLLEVSVPKTTQLRYELDSSPLRLHGDMGQIQQVIMNLIINAGEAMEAHPGYIIVRTSRIELTQSSTDYWKYTNTPLTPGIYALLQVSDTGHGMKPEILARIFDPFFTTKFTGRGLGLAAVLGIIRGHQGGVRITTEEGRGTRFDVVFPVVETPQVTNVPETSMQIVTTGEGKTVLVIDDEPSVLELVTDIFTEAKFTVIGALNPIEGIELYRQHQQQIAMIILDYSMPGMDGKTAFEELVKINNEVKVLLCSGYSEEETAAAFGTSRPAAFVQKPYKPTKLLERVSEMLSQSKEAT